MNSKYLAKNSFKLLNADICTGLCIDTSVTSLFAKSPL